MRHFGASRTFFARSQHDSVLVLLNFAFSMIIGQLIAYDCGWTKELNGRVLFRRSTHDQSLRN